MAFEANDLSPGFRCLSFLCFREGRVGVPSGLSKIINMPNPSINGGRLFPAKSAREIRRAAERFHRKEKKQ